MSKQETSEPEFKPKLYKGNKVAHRTGGPEMIVIASISSYAAPSEYRCRFWVPLLGCFKTEKFHEFELDRKKE